MSADTPEPIHKPLRRGRMHYSIAVLLFALAILPLSGAAWFAVGEVNRADRAQNNAASVEVSTQRVVRLIELQTRILAEKNLSSTVEGVRDVGLRVSLIDALTGFDLPSELAEVRTQVDELIAELEMTEAAERISFIRDQFDADGESVGQNFEQLEAIVAGEVNTTMDALLSSAGGVKNGGDLVTSLVVLRSTTIARQAVSQQFSTFFAIQFSGDRANEAQRSALTSQRSIQLKAISESTRMSPADSLAAAALEDIKNSEDVQRFNEAVEGLINSSRIDADGNSDRSLSNILNGVDRVAFAFGSSTSTIDLHFDLVDAAGDDVLMAGRQLRREAEGASNRAVTAIAGLILMSILFTTLAIYAIGRPVSKLAETARRISDGDSEARFRGRWFPDEIRDAGEAINDAALHLELVEKQALALAEGELDHPVLGRIPSSKLGASLQRTVSALASSLQDREEFRLRVAHEASHDGLTQLANRNASLAHLDNGLRRANENDTLVAVLFIDLDGFKAVNDNSGHHAGDLVLRSTAKRLLQNVRRGDLVGRIGGDEFVVIAEQVEGVTEAKQLASRILSALSEPVQIDGATVSIGASVGIALSNGRDTISSACLLRDADLAVYKAKSSGRGRIEVCDDALRADMLMRADLERSLVRAIAEDEFELHYQPIMNPIKKSVEGFEALIRWERPGHGMQFPDSFIPFAERSDLIVEIDKWVVKAAVRQLVMWDEHHLHSDVPIAINISSRHLSSPNFVKDVMNPLVENRIPPTRIIIEVTESALLDDVRDAAAKLQALRSVGVRISIDDFGTGYTSLAHLRTLPIDILKIDKSFTNDPTAISLVKLIIDIGHLLGARITAEGIETDEQAQLLTSMGCDDLQGYLYGRPQPPAKMDLPRRRSRLRARNAGWSQSRGHEPVDGTESSSRAITTSDVHVS